MALSSRHTIYAKTTCWKLTLYRSNHTGNTLWYKTKRQMSTEIKKCEKTPSHITNRLFSHSTWFQSPCLSVPIHTLIRSASNDNLKVIPRLLDPEDHFHSMTTLLMEVNDTVDPHCTANALLSLHVPEIRCDLTDCTDTSI